jgi:aerobic-type carbon monoxide dehydrogenase small subunit (CoxS/CutS family)
MANVTIAVNGAPTRGDVEPRQLLVHYLREGLGLTGTHVGCECGFCTPGMIMAAYGLLEQNPDPSEAEIRVGLEGNLCRCTGYHNIVRAVRHAADAMGRRRQVKVGTIAGSVPVTAP